MPEKIIFVQREALGPQEILDRVKAARRVVVQPCEDLTDGKIVLVDAADLKRGAFLLIGAPTALALEVVAVFGAYRGNDGLVELDGDEVRA